MSRDGQIRVMRELRESLIHRLEGVYREAFDQISESQVREGAVARLTQLLLRSRDGALTPLQEEIEHPLISHAPDPSTTVDVR